MPETEDISETSDPNSRIVAAALSLAGERGWAGLSTGDIAEAAGVPHEELRRIFPCNASLLAGLARHVEAWATAEPMTFDKADTTRDRLFELLMRRLDVLEEHRAGATAILRDLPRDPATALAALPRIMPLFGRILEQAGVSGSGPLAMLRRKGLAAIWLATLSVWAEDDSPDYARTMAALDRNLRRAEPAARLLDPSAGAARPAGGGAPRAEPGGF